MRLQSVNEYFLIYLRFLREDEHEPDKEGHDSWDKTLARKFYANLWKEYAICDLKHYKSGNVRPSLYLMLTS
jgi:hypothetical protein